MPRFRDWVATPWFVACVVLAACGTAPQPQPDLQGPIVPTRAPTATAVQPDVAPPTEVAPPSTNDVPPRNRMDDPVEVPRQTVFRAAEGGSVALDQLYEGEITDRDYAVLLTVEGQAGQTIDIEMRDVNGTLDPFLILLDGDGRELARNDDVDDQFNAALRQIDLLENATYTIVATRWHQRYGTSEGAFELEVRESVYDGEATERARRISYGVNQSGTINNDTPEIIYSFQGNAGDVVSLAMVNVSGDLDPTLKITDAFGNELAVNEDVNVLNNFEARIEALPLTYSGYYNIVATRYLEGAGTTSGRFEVRVEVEGRLPPEEQRLQMRAALDDVESNTLLTGGLGILETGFYVGDRLSNEQEARAQLILTFYMIAPPGRGQDTIMGARLDLSDCDEAGLGFDAVSGYNVYVDDVGRMDSQMPFDPSPEAELVGNFNACSDMDVTEWVQDAYNGPGAVIKFRVLPQATLENEQSDTVVFLDPRLTLQFEENE